MYITSYSYTGQQYDKETKLYYLTNIELKDSIADSGFEAKRVKVIDDLKDEISFKSVEDVKEETKYKKCP